MGDPMKRRSKDSGEPANARSPKAAKLKRRNEATRSTSSAAVKDGEVARLTSELKEALEQQSATADVLRTISSSPIEVQRVLDVIVRTAAELCASEYSILFRLQDGKYHVACSNKAGAEFVKFFLEHPISVDRSSLVGRTALERRSVHIQDCLADPEYRLHEAARLGKHRTMLGVPLLREGIPIGVIGLLRTSVNPFTEKQIELVTTFANQAVIAIENTRVLNELHQRTTDLTARTADLTEALEQQTATSEVLQVISSSPGDLQPVFASMLENAVRICGAKFANLFIYEDSSFRIVALQNAPPAYAERWRHRPVLSVADNPRNPLGRLAATKDVIDIPDLMTEPGYIERDPRFVTLVETAGARTLVAVPMLKDEQLVGAISIYRQEVQPFTDKQIALLASFAAQAVIAIENARLLNELRQRTADLGEALEQQTATSEVLQVISGSPGDLQPVFAAMLENAARICDAKFGNIFRWDGDALWLVATHNTPPAFIEHRRRVPFRPNQGNPIGDMLKANVAIHVADLARDERYIQKSDPEVVAAVELGGIRTFVAVPMLKDEKLIGAVILYRQEVRPFSDKQIELVKNFAAQAVIAIENARLLNELRQRTDDLTGRTADLTESLEQQTATANVLEVISRSAFDLSRPRLTPI
jgi:two-component system, NtrC family, sensor kinase